MQFTIFCAIVFFFGLCFGSFLNVCIWRIPRGESVVRPGSHCPKCNAPIRWYQNIPVLSWLALRGRCANCHEPISFRYTVVELLGGIVFLVPAFQAGFPAFFHSDPPIGLMPIPPSMMPVYCIIAFALIFAAFIDLEHMWLPDRVTIGGMIVGVPLSFLMPQMQIFGGLACMYDISTRLGALYWSLGGMALGFGLFWLVGSVFSKILKKDALGFGDVKLMGALGAMFGPIAVVFVLIFSSLLGSVVGIALILRGKTKFGKCMAIPYGPYIALAILIWMYWGPCLVLRYLAMTVLRDI